MGKNLKYGEFTFSAPKARPTVKGYAHGGQVTPTSMKKGGETKGQAKVAKVMGEFKRGELHSGSSKGALVKNPKQAIAIALSEKREAGYKKGGEAKKGEKSVKLVDFYADWCTACKEMEHFTFSDARVRRKLSGMTLLQVDITGNTDAQRSLLKRFGLFGPPGVIFFDSSGNEVQGSRIVGFVDAGRFLRDLDRVK